MGSDQAAVLNLIPACIPEIPRTGDYFCWHGLIFSQIAGSENGQHRQKLNLHMFACIDKTRLRKKIKQMIAPAGIFSAKYSDLIISPATQLYSYLSDNHWLPMSLSSGWGVRSNDHLRNILCCLCVFLSGFSAAFTYRPNRLIRAENKTVFPFLCHLFRPFYPWIAHIIYADQTISVLCNFAVSDGIEQNED